MKRKLIMAVIIALMLGTVATMADDKEKYQQLAEQVRTEVWSKELPAFSQRSCPEHLKHHSAVVLAAYSELSIDQHRKADAMQLIFGWQLANMVTANNYLRQLVAINDEAARKNYSEFDFATTQKGWNYGWREKRQTVVGVRVIKPSGEVREVSTDDYVSVNEGRRDRQQRQKLAVPDLQVGDLIDFFVYTIEDLQERNVAPYEFAFMSDIPMLSYQVHCVIDHDMCTQYRTLNGAPDFRSTTDEQQNVVLDVEVSNMEQTEPRMWYNSAEQTPRILLYITGKKLKGQWAPPSTRQKGLQANPPFSAIVDDDVESRKGVRTSGLLSSGFTGKDRKTWQQFCRDVASMELTAEERVARLYTGLYYLLRFSNSGQMDAGTYCSLLKEALQQQGITALDLYTTSSQMEPIDQLISYRNTTWGLYVGNIDRVLLPPSNNDMPPFAIVSDYQGRTAILENGDGTIITLPKSTQEENRSHFTLHATIDDTRLSISRQAVMEGAERERLSLNLYTPVQLMEDAFGYLGIERHLADLLGKKYADELDEITRQMSEKQKELFTMEACSYHQTEATLLDDYGVDNIGFRQDSAALVYHTSYTVDGLVKRAGPNIVLSIGQLIPSQLKMEGADRERTADIHYGLPANESVYDVTIALPQGYVADSTSLASLNTEVNNSCGAFSAHATTNGSELKLTAVKSYHHTQEPAEKWSEILQFIDAASAFTAAQVVLRRAE